MTDQATIARRWVGQAVTGMTGNTGDPHSAYHDPLEALRSLAAIGAAVLRAERDAARVAREKGEPWAQVGEAMGLKPDPRPCGTTLAEAAFEAVASDLGSGMVFGWRCPPCGQLVTDVGPYNGNPADCERGHADGCERLAEAVAAYQQEDDEDG